MELKPCKGSKEVAIKIQELFETYCKYMDWKISKKDIKMFFRTLQAFIKPECYEGYLTGVYYDIFNQKDSVTFDEFYKYLISTNYDIVFI